MFKFDVQKVKDGRRIEVSIHVYGHGGQHRWTLSTSTNSTSTSSLVLLLSGWSKWRSGNGKSVCSMHPSLQQLGVHSACPVFAPHLSLCLATGTQTFPRFGSSTKHPIIILVQYQNVLPLHPVKCLIPLHGNTLSLKSRLESCSCWLSVCSYSSQPPTVSDCFMYMVYVTICYLILI